MGFKIDGTRLITRMNQPSQAGRKDIAELLVPGAFRRVKSLGGKLPDCSADCNLSQLKMVDYAKPVLVIDSREESIKPLWVNEEGTA
jgi:hypothetical protein